MRSVLIPLRTLVAASFALIIVSVVGALVGFTYHDMATLARDEAKASFAALASNVRERMRIALEPGTVILNTLAAVPVRDTPPEKATRIVVDAMRNNASGGLSTMTALQMGWPDGSAVAVSETSDAAHAPYDARYMALVVERTADGLLGHHVYFDRAGHELGRSEPAPTGFDGRERPWYRAAESRDDVVVTQPYTYYESPNRQGVTIARRSVVDPSVVIGVDATLWRLSRTLTAIRSSADEQLIVFRANGELLAQAGEEDPVTHRGAIDAEAPRSLLLQEIMRSGQSLDGQRDFTLTLGGTPYLARVERALAGTDLFIAIGLPENAVLGPATALRSREVLLGVAAILAAIALGVAMAQGVATPLVLITRSLSRITSLQFTPATKTSHAWIREVADLWTMVATLERTLSTFACYVPKHLVRSVAQDCLLPAVGGNRQAVTVLFTDIEDFTHLAEGVAPEDLLDQMSRYFSVIASAVSRSGGLVDKYIGDSVMAVWNAPAPQPDHVTRACDAALDAAALIEALNGVFESEGRPRLNTRFGLHTGDAIVGHVGSNERLSYTVLGSAVNVASRLEGLNKAYGTNILVSGEIQREASGRFDFTHVDRVSIRGVASALDIFSLASRNVETAVLPVASASDDPKLLPA